jgi:hypothetical protein
VDALIALGNECDWIHSILQTRSAVHYEFKKINFEFKRLASFKRKMSHFEFPHQPRSANHLKDCNDKFDTF